MQQVRSSPVERLLGLLFPDRCIGCRLRGVVLCEACAADVPRLGGEVCPLCAAPSRLARICQRCRAKPMTLDGVRAACHFDGAVRTAIHDLKYRGIRSRAGLLASFVAEAVEARPLAVDVLVPVPLAPARRRQRGFNQSELLATAVSARLGVSLLASGLTRIRETPRQVGRSASERQTNVVGAFACQNGEGIVGRRVAVVDDVMTTGATLSACAEALKQAGASRVYGIVVAREG
ncbi:MAG: ComF family protein [Chloroflexota bacterium]